MSETPMYKRFSVRTERYGDAAVVTPTGELDLATSPELEEELATTGSSYVVLDLRELEFIDSSGLRTLLTTHLDAQRAGAKFSLVAGNRHVERLLEVAGVRAMFAWVTPDEMKELNMQAGHPPTSTA